MASKFTWQNYIISNPKYTLLNIRNRFSKNKSLIYIALTQSYSLLIKKVRF